MLPRVPLYTPAEQRRREKAYDASLKMAEREARRVPPTMAERIAAQKRLTVAFARFAASALGLEDEAIAILTDDFLPAGTALARWARRFDPALSRSEITQACRNAWTACGLQPLLGAPIGMTPAILGYSLLYPYTDNFLDCKELGRSQKLHFSRRFRQRLAGEELSPQGGREIALWTLVELIEKQYPRARYPEVFACLLAIHHAQEKSIAQLRNSAQSGAIDVFDISCAKGGTSVLADACLARGWLREEESRFAFAWGVLLQLGDDLQDLQEDMEGGSTTLFSGAVSRGEPLDALVLQLLHFSERVGEAMSLLPSGSLVLRDLLRMSWRSLIVMAVATSHQLFSAGFVAEMERCSPFRFAFLRSRQERLVSRQGLYSMLFDLFLQSSEPENAPLPPGTRSVPASHPRGVVRGVPVPGPVI